MAGLCQPLTAKKLAYRAFSSCQLISWLFSSSRQIHCFPHNPSVGRPLACSQQLIMSRPGKRYRSGDNGLNNGAPPKRISRLASGVCATGTQPAGSGMDLDMPDATPEVIDLTRPAPTREIIDLTEREIICYGAVSSLPLIDTS